MAHFLFHKIIWLQQVLIIFGGFYLFYLGSLMLRSSLKLLFLYQTRKQGGNLQPSTFILQTVTSRLLHQYGTPKALIDFNSIFLG
ncbi:LysE family transporter [Acinetobacter sp. 10FS3-1]|uniref:LysE family transporter n=1 Tax=Acinetobacter sp. 10FS3-1 TaxID=2563897 RepID=UPI0035A1242F